MEKMYKRVLDGRKFKGFHTFENLDESGKVELCWEIYDEDGYTVAIFINRFEIVIPDSEGDNLETVMPLKGHYKNTYVLEDNEEAADKAFDAAQGIIKALRQITYAALR